MIVIIKMDKPDVKRRSILGEKMLFGPKPNFGKWRETVIEHLYCAKYDQQSEWLMPAL